MAEPCFQNGFLQLVHRYAAGVLLLLIGIIGWWASNIDGRVHMMAQESAKNATLIADIAPLRADITTLRIQAVSFHTINATLTRHEEILRRLEERLNAIYIRSLPSPPLP